MYKTTKGEKTKIPEFFFMFFIMKSLAVNHAVRQLHVQLVLMSLRIYWQSLIQLLIPSPVEKNMISTFPSFVTKHTPVNIFIKYEYMYTREDWIYSIEDDI